MIELPEDVLFTAEHEWVRIDSSTVARIGVTAYATGELGDIVYVSFASPAARDNATKILDSDAWRALSATRDNRVFVVNNEVWQTGQNIVAARGILDDLRWVNAPIN